MLTTLMSMQRDVHLLDMVPLLQLMDLLTAAQLTVVDGAIIVVVFVD